MGAVASPGEKNSRSESATDVTDQYTDLEARLRNSRTLGERLQKLLERATDIDDVLAIERELNRIQPEIETLQVRLDRSRSEVELSAHSVSIERDRIPGPLGHIGHGVWWVISKLFVIRS